MEEKQIERVADALREVPGLSVVQTGTAGQLTLVFTRGLNSNQTQVMLDGIPLNQGLSGAFNFADLTTDNIGRIEVTRGPQSTIYGPSAMAGVIQIFTKQGEGPPTVTLTSEGGSYDTFRESIASEGKIGQFDYSVGASRLDTDNARPNNQYRNSAAIADLGWTPDEHWRMGVLLTYSLSDTGDPNTIFDPRPYDNLLVERWLIAPHVDLKITDWWEHKFILSYDHERQVNDPNDDGFTFATRALFERTQVDYQNNLRPTSWGCTITSGFFYDKVNAGDQGPFVLLDPNSSDHTENDAGFLETTVDLHNFNSRGADATTGSINSVAFGRIASPVVTRSTRRIRHCIPVLRLGSHRRAARTSYLAATPTWTLSAFSVGTPASNNVYGTGGSRSVRPIFITTCRT